MKCLLRPCNLFLVMLMICTITSKADACTGKDIIFTNITFTSVEDGRYYYSYEIKNIGTTNIVLGQVVIQNYVSTDNQVGGDAAAGGTFISYQSTEIISPGETYSGIYEANPFSQNPQSTYPYLISNVSLSSNDECDVTNNYFIGLVQVSTSVANPSFTVNVSLNWDNGDKSFTVSEWPGRYFDLRYSVYSTSGVLMISGSVQKNESTPLKSLNNGVYILHLSDGEKAYSKRITYF